MRLALKAAETDATLATFGNLFGLALYDRGLSGVKNPKALVPAHDDYGGPWLLALPNWSRPELRQIEWR